MGNTVLSTVLGCVPLGGSGSGFLIRRIPLSESISDLLNPLWTRIHRITDLRPSISEMGAMIFLPFLTTCCHVIKNLLSRDSMSSL